MTTHPQFKHPLLDTFHVYHENDPFIMDAFHLSHYDLAANRRGHLSERQIQRLRRHRAYWLITTLSFGSVLFFASLYIEWSTLEIALQYGTLDLNRLLVGMTIMLAAVIGSLVGFITINNYTNDIHKNRVVWVRGEVNLNTRTYRMAQQYIMTVGGIQFELTQNQFLALQNRETYIIYITAKTYHLLSLERIPQLSRRSQPRWR